MVKKMHAQCKISPQNRWQCKLVL